MKKDSHRMILPQHQQPITIRLARKEDIAGAKRIADQNRSELGFVNIAILRVAQSKGWLLVATEWEHQRKRDIVIGFVNFRIRQDRNATLYEIAVADTHRRTGVGTRLTERIDSTCSPCRRTICSSQVPRRAKMPITFTQNADFGISKRSKEKRDGSKCGTITSLQSTAKRRKSSRLSRLIL